MRVACSIPIPPCIIDMSEFPELSVGMCAAGGPAAYYTVSPWGELRPCNHSDQVLGNLHQARFAELIQGPAMQAFVAAHPSHCEPCQLVELCQGGCKAAAAAASGNLCSLDPFLEMAIDSEDERIGGPLKAK